mgnify:CR=1 FL=1
MTIIYGIKNCDTMKKARAFLTQAAVEHQFIDYRVDGLSGQLLQQFVDTLGWQALLNTKGTTYRALPDEQKADMTAEKAMALMLAQPAFWVCRNTGIQAAAAGSHQIKLPLRRLGCFCYNRALQLCSCILVVR